MGYSRYDFILTEIPVNRVQRGHTYKLCPYSTAYREKFKFEGDRIVGYNGAQPIYSNGIWVMGNSNDPNFTRAYDGYPCSDHTQMDGRMETTQNPPGFICRDPNCYYYTTVASGERYKEI
jgi:hypothetical protein